MLLDWNVPAAGTSNAAVRQSAAFTLLDPEPEFQFSVSTRWCYRRLATLEHQ
jgi:hypothetical protein